MNNVISWSTSQVHREHPVPSNSATANWLSKHSEFICRCIVISMCNTGFKNHHIVESAIFEI